MSVGTKRGIPIAIAVLLACAPLVYAGEDMVGELFSDGSGTLITPELSFGDAGMEPEQREVALYFRMRGEDMLVRETRSIAFSLDTPEEQLLITRLIEGPGPNLLELTGLFNPGTRVLPPSAEGSLLIITLSREFLEKPADVPENWRSMPSWHAEVLTRRMLALSSIVNTITEETEYTAVQLLVQQSAGDNTGRRIERSEIYLDGSDTVALGPVARSEGLILSSHNTANVVLDCWMSKDFDRLYRFVQSKPTEEEFRQEMLLKAGFLTGFTLSHGIVSSDGQKAVFSATLEYTNRNGFQRVQEFPLHFVWDNNLWKISYAQLLRLMEAE
ncbi:MAG: GerMN domain-containing protein [Clostridia bacterium]|nr:GerMN domain-containing protein [Clostridia bacterium]